MDGGPIRFSKRIVSPSENAPARPERPAIFRKVIDFIGVPASFMLISQCETMVQRNGKSAPSASVVVAQITESFRARVRRSISRRTS
ncbi:hypothetical protein D3C71_1734630 [compost metagenome]